MFWTIILRVYLIVTTLNLFCNIALEIIATRRFKETYGNAKLRKSPLMERIFSFFRVIFIAAIPVLNFCMLYVYVVYYEMVVEKVIAECVNKIESNSP
jgi:hypothetical protein